MKIDADDVNGFGYVVDLSTGKILPNIAWADEEEGTYGQYVMTAMGPEVVEKRGNIRLEVIPMPTFDGPSPASITWEITDTFAGTVRGGAWGKSVWIDTGTRDPLQDLLQPLVGEAVEIEITVRRL
jgi:hypothetical protein